MIPSLAALAIFGYTPSGVELLVILIVALLVFGRRLPDVARSLGKGIVEFKKGLRNVEEEVERSSAEPAKQVPAQPAGTAPKSLEASKPAEPPTA